jgi:predicted acetyltransferase
LAHFVLPDVRFRRSFIAAVREFHDDAEPVPWFVSGVTAEELEAPGAFARHVDGLLAERREDAPRAPAFVPATTLWWVEGDEFPGRLGIRHRLTAALESAGGHIGYDVRPTARRRGHGTAVLRAALPHVHRLGIDPALIMCDDTNTASRRIIEHAEARFADRLGHKLRYWLPTAPTSAS